MHRSRCRNDRLTVVLFLAILLCLDICPAQNQPAREVRAVKVEQAPKIDGVVDDAAWESAPAATDFIQQDPSFGSASTEKTEVRFLFDNKNLYIGIICYDSEPERILVNQSRRDGDLQDDDSIQIVLDTFNDHQNGFVFGTNPIGVQYDGQVSKEGRSGGFTSAATGTAGSDPRAQRGAIGGFNLNWDGTWEVRARITKRGWEAEMAIPFSTLRYASDKDVWGLNILRIVRRKNELSFWSPIPRSLNLHKVSLAGSLKGITPKDRHALQWAPYVLAEARKDYAAGETDRSGDVGLDVKQSLTSSLTLDLTYNTDFAQVEVDDQQVNLTRFDLFFPEKRPFFLENAGFFQFGTPQETEIFFSRRIGLGPNGEQIPIFGGGRLTGKVGRYSLGVLDMQTEEVSQLAPANNFFVARLNRELQTRSSVGVIFLNRQATSSGDHDDYNRTFGVDGTFGLGRDFTFYSYLAKTDTPGLKGQDYAGRAFLDYNSDRWVVRGGYSLVQDNFNPEMGFLRRNAYRKPEFTVHFNPRPDSRWIRKHDPHFSVTRFYGTDGLLESEFIHNDYTVDFQNGGNAGITFNRVFEFLRKPFEVVPSLFIPPGGYHWNELSMYYSTNPSAHFFGSIRHNRTGFYHGHLNDWITSGGFRVGEKFLFDLRYNLNDASAPWGSFRLHLIRFRSSYAFSPNKFVQALIQYNSRFHLISSNIRFGVVRQSGTGLFVVYNEQYETSHGSFPVLVRSLALKYSYLFNR
ncbi:MAG TPA: DUF5916 domain-containing protein [Acidobacteriota bacterium]